MRSGGEGQGRGLWNRTLLVWKDSFTDDITVTITRPQLLSSDEEARSDHENTGEGKEGGRLEATSGNGPDGTRDGSNGY